MTCKVEYRLLYAAKELARRRFKFNQSNVARIIGVSQAAVSNWISRGNNIELWRTAEREYRIYKYMNILKREEKEEKEGY